MNKQVQEAPGVSAGETQGFVMAALTETPVAQLVSENRRGAGLCCLGNGTVSLPSHLSGHHS